MIPSRFRYFAPPCFDHSRDETTEPDFSRPPARGLSRVTPARFGRAPERAIARRHQGRRFIPAPRVSAALSDGFVETYRGGVAAWECDVFGHLNIAFYGERFDDAGRDLLERRAPGRRWRTLSLDILYQREFRGGEGFIIRSAVVESSPQAVRIAHEAIADGSETRASLAEQVVQPLAAADGAAPIANAPGWQRFPSLAWPSGAGTIPAGRDRVKPGETEGGQMRLPAISIASRMRACT